MSPDRVRLLAGPKSLKINGLRQACRRPEVFNFWEQSLSVEDRLPVEDSHLPVEDSQLPPLPCRGLSPPTPSVSRTLTLDRLLLPVKDSPLLSVEDRLPSCRGPPPPTAALLQIQTASRMKRPQTIPRTHGLSGATVEPRKREPVTRRPAPIFSECKMVEQGRPRILFNSPPRGGGAATSA